MFNETIDFRLDMRRQILYDIFQVLFGDFDALLLNIIMAGGVFVCAMGGHYWIVVKLHPSCISSTSFACYCWLILRLLTGLCVYVLFNCSFTDSVTPFLELLFLLLLSVALFLLYFVSIFRIKNLVSIPGIFLMIRR